MKKLTDSDLSPTGRMSNTESACQMGPFTRTPLKHDFNLIGTQTGRMSCRRPNIEEIPKKRKSMTHNTEFAGLDTPIAPRQLGLDDLMPFGKFVGMTIKECIEIDPKYMDWFNDNVSKVLLNAEARTYLRESFCGLDDGDDDECEAFWREELGYGGHSS